MLPKPYSFFTSEFCVFYNQNVLLHLLSCEFSNVYEKNRKCVRMRNSQYIFFLIKSYTVVNMVYKIKDEWRLN